MRAAIYGRVASPRKPLQMPGHGLWIDVNALKATTKLIMTAEFLIHALGPKGDGIHNADRGPIYIDRALPGDMVDATIERGTGGVLRGEINRIVTRSAHRTVAPCPNYDVCGGCTLQHSVDEFYKNWKIEIVRDALRKKDLTPDVWHPPEFLSAGHRRRVTFAAFKKKNVVTLGYFRRRTHQVTNIETCLVVDPAIMALRAGLVSALVPLLQSGKAADIFIQRVNGHIDMVITGPVGQSGKPDLPVHEAFAQMVQTLRISRLSWRANERDSPEVMLDTNPVRATFGVLQVALPPLAFLQPTQSGEAALVAAVMDALPATGKFADLFSGCGTFSGAMLARGSVDAFDTTEAAIRALEKAKGTKPLKAAQRDLYRNPLTRVEASGYEAIVFDPPRAGAPEQAAELAASNVPLIIGVSCNPATFARDARTLVDSGYRLASLKVVDQFTWSHHVELVASFAKAKV